MKRGRSFWRTSCAETFPFPSMNYTLLTAPRWLTSYDRLIPRNRRRGPTFSSNNSRGKRLIIQRLSNFTISSLILLPRFHVQLLLLNFLRFLAQLFVTFFHQFSHWSVTDGRKFDTCILKINKSLCCGKFELKKFEVNFKITNHKSFQSLFRKSCDRKIWYVHFKN